MSSDLVFVKFVSPIFFCRIRLSCAYCNFPPSLFLSVCFVLESDLKSRRVEYGLVLQLADSLSISFLDLREKMYTIYSPYCEAFLQLYFSSLERKWYKIAATVNEGKRRSLRERLAN